jgi:4-hydroxybenzoate polyprenyltransferase
MKGDKKYGMRTLPVVYGVRRAAVISGPFFILPFVLILLGVMSGILELKMLWIMLMVIWGVVTALLMQSVATKQEKLFENTIIWVNMYLMLMALQIFFCATYVFNF